MNRLILLTLPLVLPLTLASAAMQTPISAPQSHADAKPAAVAYLFPEQVSIAADKPTPVDLHFKVAAGLHVNSHTPRSEELIPTTLKLLAIRQVSASLKPTFPQQLTTRSTRARGFPRRKAQRLHRRIHHPHRAHRQQRRTSRPGHASLPSLQQQHLPASSQHSRSHRRHR